MSEGGVLHGEAAALSSCRVSDRALLQSALQQIFRSDEEIMLGPFAVLARFHDEQENGDDGDYIPGNVVISSEQLLFWKDGPIGNFDLRVEAVCIDLHALTRDQESDRDDDNDDNPPSAVYLQISTSGDGHELHDCLVELTLRPLGETDEDIQRISQQLFNAITDLISLHPIDPYELDEAQTDNGGGGGNWFGDGPVMTNGSDVHDGPVMTYGCDVRDDDDLVTAAPHGAATDDERNAMLERLSNLLIVPAVLECDHHSSGQFDDADSDDELI